MWTLFGILGAGGGINRNVHLDVFWDDYTSRNENLALGCFREAWKEIRERCQNA